MPRVSHRWFGPALILACSWFANFLHFTRMGLYEDDWYFVGYAFTANFKQWMVDCLWNQLSIPEASVGRPFQFFFSFTFAELGALADSLAVDYLIAFIVSSIAALLMYRLLRRRFSTLVATLATLIFVLSPMHTLHQCLLCQFTMGGGLSLLFLAMLLYANGRRVWSYPMALLALLTYESFFFLFLAAPLMRRGRMFQGRRREWLVHLALCLSIVAVYYVARVATAEARVSNLAPGRELIGHVWNTWLVYMASSFAPYYYGILRGWHEATVQAWSYALVFAAAVVSFLYRLRPVGLRKGRLVVRLLRPAFIGCVFLALGYVVAYFVLMEAQPRLPFTDRQTRVSWAASFGSSVLVAAILAAAIRWARAIEARVALYLGTAAVLGALFLYAFVLQTDYTKDWAMQRDTVRQFMALTPDIHEDSILILRFPSLDPGLAGQPAIGADQDGFHEVLLHIFNRSQKLPELFIVVSDDWPKYLKLDADGFLVWKAPYFPGRWFASTGRHRPGRFVVLDERERGHMVRRSEPMEIDGVQIVQQVPSAAPSPVLWTSLQRTPLFRKLLP